MRIADVVAVLDPRPDAVVAGNDEAEQFAQHVVERTGLIARGGEDDSADEDVARAVLVVAEERDVTTVIARAPGLRDGDHCLLLLAATGADLPDAEVATAAAEHGLELVEVVDLAHPTLRTALRLVVAGDAEVAAARTELLLEREVSRQVRAAAEAAQRELTRRGERIDALRAEVTELRERVETLEVQHERDVATRERALTSLRGEVDELEGSASYRIGHALVRLVKDPSLLRRVPARLLRWLRS